ncbi:F0F1 ATP synthase subunit delta [Allonocardiopsis opalescens]|uniref:ATP synthase subunit delta n=1 Tax=Allonocardiopsis opalescens TaxID=1144618 RepID=A0A2T0QCZ4_9ACTN|nr:F0F1 ATP synthase subunit delta [Allonocardiopsis opalescens]PRY01789.1 ATP synthase F1 subcomplex delta subunit [Allonocardiopsis opalescens]
MRGVSRTSLAEVTDRFNTVARDADAASLGGELFDVVALLDREHSLRRVLADPSVEADRKSRFAADLLEGKVSPTAALLVDDVVRARWSRGADLTDAVERLAVFATVLDEERSGRLDDVEDELFRFDRIVAAEPALRSALTDRSASAEREERLLADLLGTRASAATRRLVGELVTRPRGRNLEVGLEAYSRLVAERRRRLVAVVRSAVPLSERQRARLVSALSSTYGRPVHVNIEVDPEVMGGMSVRIGDEVIDGTVAGRLAEIRKRLAG